MKKITFIFLVCLSHLVYGRVFDVKSFGNDIEWTVRQFLALNGMGNGIRETLIPINTLGTQSGNKVISNLISMDTNPEEFGNELHKEVERRLLLFKAKVMKSKMMNGVGGNTVVRYGDGKNLMVKNGYHYECYGNSRNPCQGSLYLIKSDENNNYCYMNRTIRNDVVCIIDGNNEIYVHERDGFVSCTTNNNGNTTLSIMPKENYSKICDDKGRQATFTYIPDVANPEHVQIPNDNTFLKCQNSEPNICVFRTNRFDD